MTVVAGTRPLLEPASIPDTVPALLKTLADTRPAQIASVRRVPGHGWTSTTWADLWRAVMQTAVAFRSLGLQPGHRLGILAHTCQEWQIAEMAGLVAGGVIVGIDPHAAGEQIVAVIERATVSCLVVDTAGTLDKLPSGLIASLRFVVVLEPGPNGIVPPGAVRWADLASMASPEAVDPDAVKPDDTATVIYTSGTLGRPKAIPYTHAQLMVACRAIAQEFRELGETDSLLCWLPMAALFQRMMNLVVCARGATTWFLEDPRTILDAMREVKPTVMIAVPRFYEKLHDGIREELARQRPWKRRLATAAIADGHEVARHARTGARAPWPLRLRHRILDRLVLGRIRRVVGGRIRWMITGSAPIAPALLEFFHGIGILVLEAYGVSENTIPMAANRLGAYRFGSVGRPFAQNELLLTEEGELLVRGPGVFKGYEGVGAAPDTFTAEGYYRTGDYARIDDDGFLYLVGRTSQMIKTSTGHRLSPEYVEAVHRESPYIDQIMIVGDNRKHVVALVVLNDGAVTAARARAGLPVLAVGDAARDPFAADLVRTELEACGRRLAAHERPYAFAILPEPFSIANGELTAKLSLRRTQIEARYRAVIEQLYTAQPPSTTDHRVFA